MTEFKELMALSRGFKIFFAVLSIVAMAGLLGAFALQSWAKDKIQHGEFVLNGTDKSWQKRLESGFAYDSGLYFEKADFLLRSKVIAYIDIREISWALPIDKNAVSELKSHNRHIKFSTSQNLSEFNGQKLGVVEYKMDFSPLLKTIVKYYLIILFTVYVGFILYKVLGIDIGKMVKFLSQNSLPQALWQGYKAINPLYRHTFWIVFIALNLVFGFHTVQFLWGNHDWGAVLDGYGMLAEVYIGRYTQNIISMFLQGERLLPILNNIIAFVGLALASVLLCAYLNLPKKLYIWVIVGFLLTLTPFTLTRMYYAFQVSGLFIGVAIGILGFVLAKKAGEYNINSAQNGGGGGGDFCHSLNAQKSQNSLDILPNLNKSYHKPYALCLLSILCIHWGIASYQPFIDTALILLCGGIIAIIIDNKGDLKLSFYKSRFLIISVAFAAISYKIVLDILKRIGTTQEIYNNTLTPLLEMPERMLFLIKTAFSNLITYQYAFMPLSITYIFLAFLIILVSFIVALSLNIKAKISIFTLFVLSLFATLTHIALSKTLVNSAILDFYGLLFWRVLVVALVLKISFEFVKSGQMFRNVVFVLGVILLWICVVCDLHAQRMQKLAFDTHTNIINRVVAKIEENENFNYDNKYFFIMFGDITNMRHRYGKPYFDILPQDRIAGSGRGLGGYGTLVPTWSPLEAFEFYMPKSIGKGSFGEDNFGNIVESSSQSKTFSSLISRLHKAGILDKLEPFPHKDSVVVFEDIIVFVASKGNLDEIRQMAKAQDNGAEQ